MRPELTERRRHLLVWLLAVTVGGLAFFAWIGYARTLDPTSLRWIFHEDPFTHVMGWEQFRNAPLLQYPITKNHLYGLEWSSSIVFTDSIPIAALVLRPFSALLPHPFQYLGWWVLLSMILQAYFGARLVLLRSDRLRDAALGAIFFVTTPVLLERLGLQTGVGSHWLILWALWLYFSQRRSAPRAWAVLLLLTVAVHAYLFAMVGAIWVAHLAACRLRGELSRVELAYAGAVVAGVLVWMHVLGYFLVGDGAAAGGVRTNFDVLGFIEPSTGARFGLMRSVYGDAWDGSYYLGAGLLVLLATSAVAALWRRPSRGADARWLPLVVVVLGLAVFAITSHITIAGKTLASFRLPHAFDGIYATFRGAARMAWPAYYLTMTATLWLALRAWPARVLGWVLAAATAVQLLDLSGVAALKRGELDGNGMTRPLADPIWTTIAQHYQRIVSVPARQRQTDWPTFAWFAARNGLGSNIGYLSRSNPQTRMAGARANLDAVSTGKLDPGTVYYFPGEVLWTVARQAMGPQDVAIVADGYHLVLPGGRAWVKQPAAPVPAEIPWLGTWIAFSGVDAGNLLIDGWGWLESWGTWSSGPHAWMVLPVPPRERVRVTFKWLAYAELHEHQSVHVHLDGQTFDVTFPRRQSERTDSFEVTTSSRLLDVHIDIDKPRDRPPQVPIGIGLIAVKVQRASDPVDDGVPDAARGTPVLDSWVDFTDKGTGRALLAHGWSYGESWGTWSDDIDPTLAIPVPPNEHLQLTFRWTSAAAKGQHQTARVFVDDKPLEVTFPPKSQTIESTFDVTSQRGWAMVRLEIANPVEARDGRLLGIGIEAVRVTRVSH